MAGVAEVTESIDVDAPPAAVFAALVDWDRQREWMLLTRVRGGHGPGATVEAFTGLGRVGFVDTMTITQWQPPHRCVVVHTGRVVRGSAAFEVLELPGGRSRVVWTEWLVLPLGLIGALGFALIRPLAVAGVRYSLKRFAAWAAAN